MNDYDFAGKTVLVTGASMGIGAAFARELSRRGSQLILVARSADKLNSLAAELGGAQVIAEDLTKPGAAQRVFDAVSGPLDVLINNAGFGLHGKFDEATLTQHREEIDLNIVALYELTYLFMPGIEQRQGGVIQLCSVAGYMPIPYMAVYAATKAFVLSFSEALWAEYQPRGVRVLCLAPGATDTAFFDRSGTDADPGPKAKPEDVANYGLRAFVKGRASVVHGGGNKVMTSVGRFFGRQFLVKNAEKLTRPRSMTLAKT